VGGPHVPQRWRLAREGNVPYLPKRHLFMPKFRLKYSPPTGNKKIYKTRRIQDGNCDIASDCMSSVN
jgi:hypothetical protein